MGVSVANFSEACIHHYYHGVIIYEKLKDQNCNAQNIMSGKMSNNLFDTYKILSFHMESICFRQHLTRKWQKCMHIHNQTMNYYIGPVF